MSWYGYTKYYHGQNFPQINGIRGNPKKLRFLKKSEENAVFRGLSPMLGRVRLSYFMPSEGEARKGAEREIFLKL